MDYCDGFSVIAFPMHLETQSPHPWHRLESTIAGSAESIWKIALMLQILAAGQSLQRRHLVGSTKALCNPYLLL
jgi:hypothetical protein